MHKYVSPDHFERKNTANQMERKTRMALCRPVCSVSVSKFPAFLRIWNRQWKNILKIFSPSSLSQTLLDPLPPLRLCPPQFVPCALAGAGSTCVCACATFQSSNLHWDSHSIRIICSQFDMELVRSWAYDDAFSERRWAELEMHLASCAECKQIECVFARY